MADSLDDFFAKKDKSKKKGKSKFTANELLAKQEEKPKKTLKRKKEEKPAESTPGEGEPVNEPKPKEEEEWTEYAEEKETDYSGLRIQSIQIREDDNNQEDKEKATAEGEEGEDGEERSEGPQGAWATSGAAPPPTVEPVVEDDSPPLPNVKSGKYVPPNMRNQSGSSEAAPRSHPRRKKEAPNLQSEEDFPTLGGPAPEDMASVWGSGARFEKVKSGGRQVEDHSNRGPRLELGNKYDALRGGTD